MLVDLSKMNDVLIRVLRAFRSNTRQQSCIIKPELELDFNITKITVCYTSSFESSGLFHERRI